MRRDGTIWFVLLAAALRLPGLWTDFWLDEIWALDNVGRIRSPLGVFTEIHHDSNHWLISLWMYGVGQDAAFWVYRVPSFLAGVLAVIVAGRMAGAEGSSRRLAMLLVAVSFPLGFYASEARGYAIASTAALTSVFCLRRWLDGYRPAWLLLTWAASVTGLLAHLSFVAVLGAEAVFLAAASTSRKAPLGRLLLPVAGPAVALMALTVADLRHLQFGGGPALDAGLLLTELGALAVGAPLGFWWTVILACMGGVGVLALLASHLRNGAGAGPTGGSSGLGLFYAAILLLPVLIALAVQPPFLFPRYFLVCLVFVPVLMAAGLERLPAMARAAIVIAVIGLNASSWLVFWRDGRGHYEVALVGMLHTVPDGPVTVGSDHDFRNRVIVDFYRRRLGAAGTRLSYVTRDPEFLIVSSPATPLTPDLCGECRAVRSYSSSVLSGAVWRIYRVGSEAAAARPSLASGAK